MPLVFMPLVFRRLDLEAVYFADDTNLTAIGLQCADIKEIIKKFNDLLNSNKSVVNISKNNSNEYRTDNKVTKSAQRFFSILCFH